MRTEVDELLSRRGGVASRAELLRVLTRSQFDYEVARGYLVAPFPRPTAVRGTPSTRRSWTAQPSRASDRPLR